LKFVDLVGSKVRVNLSASEIVKLANQIIAKSNEVHNSVASVPLDKVLSIIDSLILLFLLNYIFDFLFKVSGSIFSTGWCQFECANLASSKKKNKLVFLSAK
jgi:hypothetical protein